jgi:hypothetical protein
VTVALPKPAIRSVVAIAAASFLVLVLASTVRPYGWFIDELYYLACARRLAFGYVDHPPLSIAILAAVRAVAGDSLFAVRLVAAVAFAVNVMLCGMFARELGGGRVAQCVAAFAFASGTGFLVMASFFSMNVFEVLAWTLIAFAFARALRLCEPRRFVVLGVLVGLALQNKHTVSTFVGALGLALVATPERKHLRTRWPWVGAVVAGFIVFPNLLWQWRNGWPSLEFYAAAQALKNVPTSPAAAIFAQVTLVGPFAFALALVGAAAAIRADDWRRVLGITFAVMFVVMIFSNSSRPDRIAGTYPMAFGAGAVVVERLTERRRWLVPLVFGALFTTALVFGPVGLPILSPPRAAAYAARLGVVPRVERKGDSALPQWLADRLGWEAFAIRVADVVAGLPDEDRARAVLLAGDYGHAGALELFGREKGLGVVVSNHNSYWVWSRGVVDAPPVIVAVDFSEDTLRKFYDDVAFVGTFHCDGCMPSRNDLRIAVARHPRRSIADAWADWKHFE